MNFKKGQLVAIFNCSQSIEDKWIDAINKTCDKYSINTILRLAGFISQVGHESGNLRLVEENLNYSASGLQTTFGKYFDSSTASAYARQPEKIANRVYASRMGNGPESSGDGWKYRGRGLIQCTGKSNYNACARSIGVNCLTNPDMLTTPEYAAMSAGWFWNSQSLNDYADRKDVLGMTKKINGGTNGLSDRQQLYDRAIVVLSGGDPDEGLTDAQKAANLKKRAESVPPATTGPITEKNTPGAKTSSIGEKVPNSGGSEYPYNSVFQSRSGHVTQIDDTPGNEQISTMHRTGSYWAIDPKGTYTHKSVNDAYKLTKGNSYEYAGGDYTNQTQGQFYVSSSSDLILRSMSGIYMNAPRVQANTSMFAVSGEVTANRVSTPMLTAQFSDTLAKEAMSAWSIRKGAGGAPILSNSMGFSGTPGTESLRSNNLANMTPNGKSVISNGVSPNSAANAAGTSAVNGENISNSANAAAQAALAAMGITAPFVENAIRDSAAEQLDGDDDPSETPVFLKHVSFDKPTLFSQSTDDNVPDPSLYYNNLHIIVDTDGKGTLVISDGTQWNPVADPTTPDNGPYQTVVDQLNAEVDARIAAINKEAADRAAALLAEAAARTQALIDEASARQQVAQDLLTEVNSRNQALTDEAKARDDQIKALGTQISDNETIINNTIESLATKVNSVTAVNGDYVTAIQTEQTARIDGDTALSNEIDFLTSTNDIAIAAVKVLSTTQTVADTSLSQRITELSSNFDTSTATINQTLTTLASQTEALATSVDTLTTQYNTDISAAILEESTARSTADDSITRQITTLVSEVGDNTASIQSEIQTRTTLTDSFASRLDTLDTNVGDNLTAITSEITNRTTADTALGDRIDTLTTRVGASEASVTSEVQARSDADSALGTRIDTLTTRVGDSETAISTETTARTTADTALGSRIDTITTTVNGNTSAITSEIQSRTDGDSALSSRIDTLSSTVSGNTASIASESQTRSDQYSATSSQLSSLSTTVSGNTSSITTMNSSVNGLLANYGVKVDNNGYISGFGLLSQPYNGNIVSSFTILADKFALVKPGGGAVVPFSVDTTVNPPIINVNGQLRINGVNVNSNSISTSHIIPGAVSSNISAAFDNTALISNAATNQNYDRRTIISSFQYYGGKLLVLLGGDVEIDLNYDGTFTEFLITIGASIYLTNLSTNGDYVSAKTATGGRHSGGGAQIFFNTAASKLLTTSDIPPGNYRVDVSINTNVYDTKDNTTTPTALRSIFSFANATIIEVKV